LGQFASRTQDQRTGCGGFEVAWVGGVFAAWALRDWFAFGLSLSHHRSPFVGFLFVLRMHLRNQGVQHRQQERSCFAATSLARHHQVVELLAVVKHGHGNGFGLHRGGLRVAQVSHSGNQLGREA